jgi:hypothetical protein
LVAATGPVSSSWWAVWGSRSGGDARSMPDLNKSKKERLRGRAAPRGLANGSCGRGSRPMASAPPRKQEIRPSAESTTARSSVPVVPCVWNLEALGTRDIASLACKLLLAARCALLYSRFSLIPKLSTDILPLVGSWGSSWNQMIPPQIPPASGIWWNQMIPPPDPTRSHQIPPISCARLGVKKMF